MKYEYSIKKRIKAPTERDRFIVTGIKIGTTFFQYFLRSLLTYTQKGQ